MVISEDLFSKFNLNELLLDIDANDNTGLLDSANWLDEAFYAVDDDVSLAAGMLGAQSKPQQQEFGVGDNITALNSPTQGAAGLQSDESVNTQSGVNWSPGANPSLGVSPSDDVASLVPTTKNMLANSNNNNVVSSTNDKVSEGASTVPLSANHTQSLTQNALGKVGGPVRHRGRRRANRITVAAVRQAMQLSERQQTQKQHPSDSVGDSTTPSTLVSSNTSPTAPARASVTTVQPKVISSAETFDFAAFDYAASEFSLSTADMELCLDSTAATDESSSNTSQKLGSMASTMTNLTNFAGLENPSSAGRLSLEGSDTVGPNGKRLKQGELQAAQIMGTQLSKNDLEKLEAKLEKNRKMAKESRQKKKEYVKGIEQRCRQYELVIQKLNERLAATCRCNGALIAELVASNNGVLPPNVAAILQLNLPAYTPVGFGGPGVPLMPSGGTPISMSNLTGNAEAMRQFALQAQRQPAQQLSQMRTSIPGMDPTLRPGMRLPPHAMAAHPPAFGLAQPQPAARQNSVPVESKDTILGGPGTPLSQSQQASPSLVNVTNQSAAAAALNENLTGEVDAAHIAPPSSVGEALVA